MFLELSLQGKRSPAKVPDYPKYSVPNYQFRAMGINREFPTIHSLWIGLQLGNTARHCPVFKSDVFNVMI